MLSSLVISVPVRSIQGPDDPSRIGELCDVLAADAAKLSRPNAQGSS
jgi:hypothetical protein